uniref:Hexosyltransferase n=1 Tax=Fibrocapsa japonica TaxID=94617 RepID=A0A7S2Y0F1_9STRA
MAFVTILTNDSFKMGVEVLLFSLEQTSMQDNVDVVILVTPQVSQFTRNQLVRSNRRIKQIEPIENPNAEAHVQGWVDSGYAKLRLWGLLEYSRVVYLDADCLVMEPIHELFEREADFAAAPDVFPPDKFNAGVLVLKPDQAVYEDMLSKLNALPSYDGGDTGFLNAYFPDWFSCPAASRLPFAFNAQRTLHWLTAARNPGYWQAAGPHKIIHYSSNPKPWDSGAKKGELEMIWWQYYLRSRMLG